VASDPEVRSASRSARARERRGRRGGAAAVEWIIGCVLIAITSIAGLHTFSASFRCRVALATSTFGGDPATACPASAGDDGGSCSGGSCAPNSGNCFVAGTLVTTETGPQPIEQLTVGTRVLSRDEGGAPGVSWKPVLRTFRRVSDDLVRLTIVDGDGGRETLEVTREHRLRVAGRGWLEAGALIAGVDQLERLQGAPLAVAAVDRLTRSTAVFNVEVEALHSYYVGLHQAWAHNDCQLPTSVADANTQKQPGWIWAGNAWTGAEIRQHYNDMIAQIKSDEQQWKQDGLSLEQQAKSAYDIRHNARMTARAMMGTKYFPWLTNWISVANLQFRDWQKYGNGDGPTFDQLFAKAKAKGMTDEEAWQSILDSSGRTDPGYNASYGATSAAAGGPQIGNVPGPPPVVADPSADPDP
jgi:hypothetical protein